MTAVIDPGCTMGLPGFPGNTATGNPVTWSGVVNLTESKAIRQRHEKRILKTAWISYSRVHNTFPSLPAGPFVFTTKVFGGPYPIEFLARIWNV